MSLIDLILPAEPSSDRPSYLDRQVGCALKHYTPERLLQVDIDLLSAGTQRHFEQHGLRQRRKRQATFETRHHRVAAVSEQGRELFLRQSADPSQAIEMVPPLKLSIHVNAFSCLQRTELQTNATGGKWN